MVQRPIMPAAIDAPWDVIRERYSKGVSANALGREYGIQPDTIYQRAQRGRWRLPVSNIEAQVEGVVKNVVAKRLQEVAPEIEDAVQRYKDKALRAAEGLVARVSESLPEAAPRDLSGLASALLSSDTVARRTLGLDVQDQEARTIAVAVQFPASPTPSRPYPSAVVDCNRTMDGQEHAETLAIQPENS